MNGYDLTRQWYDFKFENPDKVRAMHSDFYFYLVDKWNRMGQVTKIGLPTDFTMKELGIKSYNTYKKILNDLIEFGFVKLVLNSKNQHYAKVIALSINDKASNGCYDKALLNFDEATNKATNKATDTIIEQQTTNNKEDIYRFSSFWDLYDKKKDTAKCQAKWDKMTDAEKKLIIESVPIYVSNTKDPQYRKNPLTWLNGKCWLDETPVININSQPIKKYSEW